jgi:TolB-like protein/DNA-binding winged helix-turn-helix (wHTH) protein
MPSVNNSLYEFGEFSLDTQSRALRRGAAIVALTPKALELLLVLVENAGRTVTKDDLIKAVWPESFVEESNLTQTVFMVRKALDETADRRFIKTVQGQGYRFVVPVKPRTNGHEKSETQPTLPTATPVPELSAPREKQGAANWRWPVVALASVALLLAVAYAMWSLRSKNFAYPEAKVMLAVLPFENFTGDPAQDYFSDGMTEEIISQLGNLDPAHLGVIARTSVMHYKRSQESIHEIGNNLGVQYVIEGSVRRDSERVRITAQLIQVKDQSHLWAREYDRDLGHLLELQEEIAREVANEIEVSLSGRQRTDIGASTGASASGAKSYEAYDLYLKGRYFWNKRTSDGFRQAADYFQQAIDKDPNYGRAYAGLADTFSLMSTWYEGPPSELMPKARAAAERALKLDDHLAEAHASLALIKENYDYDWSGSENEFRRAIQLDPQYATAHQWYAEFLSGQGRFDEALAESERARQLASDHASILYYSRQYEGAVRQCRSVLELDPNFDHARAMMIPANLQLGNYTDAIEEVKHWEDREDTPWVWAWEAAVYSRSGHSEEAKRALTKLERASNARADRVPTLLLGYSGTDQKERLIELLQKAYTERSNAIVHIKVDPIYDQLRDDPRFQDLLRQTKLNRP